MKPKKRIIILTFLFLNLLVTNQPELFAVPPTLEQANKLFQAGKFAEAEKLYLEAIREDPQNFRCLVHLGRIALLSNRLDEAEKWLTQATRVKPEESIPKALLAEIYYRRDDFLQAAQFFRAVGRESMAQKLESFKGLIPYRMKTDKPDVTRLKFVMTDPLPIIEVQVNRNQVVNFFLDTGAAEVVIDSELAKELGVPIFETEMGVFAGGQQANYAHGRMDSLKLGDFEIENIPVHIMDVRRFSAPIFKGKRVDGIIGTVFLYHFIVTIDYPGGELLVQKKTKENLQKLEKQIWQERPIVVPFWLAFDHYILAWGRVNQSPERLFLVDTGLAGGGFTCPESTLKEAQIKLMEDKATEGLGGGGKIKVIPFIVEELSLGEAKEKNVVGLFTGTFPLEKAFGFRIGGLISHGFFKPYALTFDFDKMRLLLKKK
ncbi:MAG: aspartyl protease family protein [Candidatus Aminicenantes bacterium]|nr:aspartyl protease family protein [Candidatus Aminicenantes bacterium]